VSFVGADVSSSSGKQSKGPLTGVEFRYYELLSEYQSLLSTEQQDKLRAWHIKNKGHKKQKAVVQLAPSPLSRNTLQSWLLLQGA